MTAVGWAGIAVIFAVGIAAEVWVFYCLLADPYKTFWQWLFRRNGESA